MKMLSRAIMLLFATALITSEQAGASRASTDVGSSKSRNSFAVTVTETSPGDEYGSSMTVSFPGGLGSKTQRAAVRREITSFNQSKKGPSGAIIHCNNAYAFPDTNGTFSIQRSCSGTTAPWAFRIAPHWCAVAISGVAEHGMAWTRNGAVMARQRLHHEGCAYIFHGTFNPARANDKVTYIDLFDFTVDIAGNIGSARLTIRGDYTYSSSPCSPTSC
jgi:hypothetical protein